MRRHLQKNLGGAGALEIEHQRALVAIPVEDSDRHAATDLAGHHARNITFGRFNLDYVGAEIAKHHRAERPRNHHAQIEHANPLKWPHRNLQKNRSARCLPSLAYSSCRQQLTTWSRPGVEGSRIPETFMQVSNFPSVAPFSENATSSDVVLNRDEDVALDLS